MNSEALLKRIRFADALSSFFYYLLISLTTAGVAIIAGHIYVVLNSSAFVIPPRYLLIISAVSIFISALFAVAKSLFADRVGTLYMIDKRMDAGCIVLAAYDIEKGNAPTRFESEIRERADAIRRCASEKSWKGALSVSAISLGVSVIAAAGVYVALFGIRVPQFGQSSLEFYPYDSDAILDFEVTPSHGIVPFPLSVENKSVGFDSYEWRLDDRAIADVQALKITSEGDHRITLIGKRKSGVQAITKVVHGEKSKAVLADFQAFPRKGKAPLKVFFEDRSQGEITARTWGLSDPEFEQVGRNPLVVEHTFRKPGTYTISLKVENSVASNLITKKDYVVVEGDPGSGGQAGGGHSKNAKSSGGGGGQADNQAAGARKGVLFGGKNNRPDVKFEKQEISDNPTMPDYYKEIISKIRSSEKGGTGGASSESGVRQILEKISYYERIQEKHRLLLNNYYEELIGK